MTRKSSLAALLLLSALWFAPMAHAQDDVDPAKKAKAQKLFEEAEKQYYLGRFSKALKLYSKAYELAPLPGFLFNIGQCHRMMGNYGKAVFFYRGYLRATDAANRSVVEKLIKECQAKAAAKQNQSAGAGGSGTDTARQGGSQKAGQKTAHGRVPSPGALARTSNAAAAQVAETKGGPLQDSGEEKERRARPWYKTWWFWTAVGVGVAVVAGATVGGVLASRDQGTETPSGSLGTIDRR